MECPVVVKDKRLLFVCLNMSICSFEVFSQRGEPLHEFVSFGIVRETSNEVQRLFCSKNKKMVCQDWPIKRGRVVCVIFNQENVLKSKFLFWFVPILHTPPTLLAKWNTFTQNQSTVSEKVVKRILGEQKTRRRSTRVPVTSVRSCATSRRTPTRRCRRLRRRRSLTSRTSLRTGGSS